MKSEKQPAPNLKNKTFVAWQRSESCKKQEDNLVSSDWHEKLKRMGKFVPVYDNKPVNMVYLMSGEYGRIWMRERDEWFKTSYIPQPRLQDLANRQKKIRMAARAAKKAAQISALERKKRREKELEAKQKAKAEEMEKLKERVRKIAAPKLPPKTPKAKKKTAAQAQSSPEQEETTDEKVCPKGWKQVELTLQCECPEKKDNKKSIEDVKGEQKIAAGQETEEQKVSTVKETEEQNISTAKEKEESKENCVMCDGFIEQMKNIHDKNVKEATDECERGAMAQ